MDRLVEGVGAAGVTSRPAMCRSRGGTCRPRGRTGSGRLPGRNGKSRCGARRLALHGAPERCRDWRWKFDDGIRRIPLGPGQNAGRQSKPARCPRIPRVRPLLLAERVGEEICHWLDQVARD